MSSRDLAAVVLTAIGAWWFLQGLWYVALVIPALGSGDDFPLGPFTVLGTSLSQVLIGSGLIAGRDRLSRWLFPSSSLPKTTAGDLRAVLFSLLGLVLVVHALYGVVQTEVTHLLKEVELEDQLGYEVFGVPAPEDLMASRIARAVELAMGAALLFGAEGLSGIVNMARRAGRQR